jgi:DNA-directed RNA polymerase subunit F
MRIVELTEEELDELIHLSGFASCEDNTASRLFDKLTAIKAQPKREHTANDSRNMLIIIEQLVEAGLLY